MSDNSRTGAAKVRFRVRLFRFCEGWLRRLVAAVSGLHEAIWLGFLDERDWQELTRLQYARWSHYGHDSHNLSGLKSWEEKSLSKYFSGCRSVLVAAAGGGREALALAKRGIRVEAFDIVPELVSACAEGLAVEDPGSKAFLALPSQVPDDLGIHDGLIVGWGGYVHMPRRRKRVDFLKEMRRHARANSPLLLSFLLREEGRRGRRALTGVANFLRRLRNREPIETGDSLDQVFGHRFTRSELESELAAAGFQMVHFAEHPYPHSVALAVQTENSQLDP